MSMEKITRWRTS